MYDQIFTSSYIQAERYPYIIVQCWILLCAHFLCSLYICRYKCMCSLIQFRHDQREDLLAALTCSYEILTRPLYLFMIFPTWTLNDYLHSLSISNNVPSRRIMKYLSSRMEQMGDSLISFHMYNCTYILKNRAYFLELS
jgi:hypothetical protein